MSDEKVELPQGTLDLLILNAGAGAAARLGHRRAPAADFIGCAAGAAGIALPGAPSPRAARLDQGALGRVGEQSPREVLRADRGRAEAAGDRDEDLASAGRGGRASPRHGIGVRGRGQGMLERSSHPPARAFQPRRCRGRARRRTSLPLGAAGREARGRRPERRRGPATGAADVRRPRGLKDACRDARGVRLIDHTMQDLRYAVRVLRASPAFTAVALLSLALGIGATTAVFTVLDAVVMRPLAVTDPHSLVVVRAMLRNERFVLFNPVYEALRSRQRALTDMAAVSDAPFLPVSLRPSQPPVYLRGTFVSGSYFSLLGVQPAIGRGLTGTDDQPGASCAAVISHRLWRSRMAPARRRRWVACCAPAARRARSSAWRRRHSKATKAATRLTSGCRCARFTSSCSTITAWRFSPASSGVCGLTRRARRRSHR